MHEQLLVGIAGELGFGLEPFGPGFLDDGLAGVGVGFVERGDGVEVDVLVERVLKGGCYVVGVVMVVVAVVVVVGVAAVVVAMVLIMAMARHCCKGFNEAFMVLCPGWKNRSEGTRLKVTEEFSLLSILWGTRH